MKEVVLPGRKSLVIRAGLPRPRQPALSQCICPKQNNPGFDVGFLGLRQRWSDAPASEGWCSGVLRTHPSRMPPPSGAKLLGRPRSVSSKWTLRRDYLSLNCSPDSGIFVRLYVAAGICLSCRQMESQKLAFGGGGAGHALSHVRQRQRQTNVDTKSI